MRKQRVESMSTVPMLAEFMMLAGATKNTLATASGVSHQTILKAKKGKPIRVHLAGLLIQTLEEREFKSYSVRKYGPRGKYKPRNGPTSAYKWVNRKTKHRGDQ